MTQFRPRKLLAFVYSFLAPGLGHLYTGRTAHAVAFAAAASFGFALIYNQLFIHSAVRIGFLLLLVFGAIQLWSMIDAVRSARAAEPHEPRWFQRWYSLIGFAVIFSLISDQVVITVRDDFESFRIPSESMKPALEPGDNFIVDKRRYRYFAPERGDLVVALSEVPGSDDKEPILIVRRIIALEGDQVELRGTQLVLNGRPAEEPYAIYTEGGRTHFPSWQVPRGSVLLLGDNRDRSKEAASKEIRFTPVSSLLGRATVVYFNPEDFGRLGTVIKHDGPHQ